MVVDLNEVMQTKKQYSDSTLNNMRKADLIKYVRQCEWNRDVAISFNQQQYKNYIKMVNKPIKTNADYIRSLSDEELAEYLCGTDTGYDYIKKLAWLKAEREGV